jgi:transketolase
MNALADPANLREAARRSRAAILQMTTLAASGHPGGSLSSIDFLLALYSRVKIDTANPGNPDRDYVVVSNGHISPAIYCALAARGMFDMTGVVTGYRQAGSIFEGHVEPAVPGVEWGTGNLGQGLSAGTGFALALRLKGLDNNVYVAMGDGEQQKGQIGEARRFAVKYGLKITAMIDFNRLQIGGDIDRVMPQHIAENWRSDGWRVIEADGHDFSAILSAYDEAANGERPAVILFHTVMGKGVSFMENQAKYHGSPLSETQLVDALKELGVSDDTVTYRRLRSEFSGACPPAMPDRACPRLSPGAPRVYDASTDNRSAFGNALADLATTNGPNPAMAVFDCDLKGSVKVDAFEKACPGHFFEVGIMEHHAAVMAGALSVCGFQPWFADFGVFGVCETYNQHRLSDINHGNVRIAVTHVGLDVGEDGKTHQCIDYLGLFRNLYHFKALVPADPNQTDRIVRWMGAQTGNMLIAMGRNKLPILKNPDGTPFFGADYMFEYGKADLLREGGQVAIMASGPMTPRATEAADRLGAEGISIAVWNVSAPLVVDRDMLFSAASTGLIVTVEDHHRDTGLGATVAMGLIDHGLNCRLIRLGVSDYACSGKSDDVFRLCGLDVNGIAEAIRNALRG